MPLRRPHVDQFDRPVAPSILEPLPPSMPHDLFCFCPICAAGRAAVHPRQAPSVLGLDGASPLPLGDFTSAEVDAAAERGRVYVGGKSPVDTPALREAALARISDQAECSHTLNLQSGEVRRTDHAGPDALAALARLVSPQGSQTPSAAGSVYRDASCAPVSNTGAQNAVAGDTHQPLQNRALVDYLGCTFHGETAMEDAERYFGNGTAWDDCDKGGYFFNRAKRRGEVTIYYDHMKPDIAMGNPVFVLARGKGCRQLEAEGVVKGSEPTGDKASLWQPFLADLLAAGATFPRFDAAIDCFDGSLNLDVMTASIQAGLCCSRYKKVDPRKPLNPSDGSVIGHSVDFGVRSSDSYLRAYHKGLEQYVKGEAAEVVDWVRVELEMHDDRALRLVQKLVQFGMKAVAEVLWSYLDFKDPDSGYEEKTKKATVSWWSDFLEATQKMCLGSDPKDRDLRQIASWIVRQVAPSLYVLREAVGGGRSLIDAIIDTAAPRLSNKLVAVLVDAARKGLYHEKHRFGDLLCAV